MTTNEKPTKKESKIMTNGAGKGLIAGGLLVAGGLVGSLLGILYAPKSGKETRKGIRRSAEGMAKKVKDQYDDTYRKIGKLASRTKGSIIGK